MSHQKRSKSRGGRPNPANEELMAAVRELAEAARTGDFSKFTVREVEIPAPASYRPKDVRKLRESLGVSQGLFAMLLGVSPELVKHWEHGIRKPAAVVCRLLDQVKENPRRFLDSLVKHRTVA